MSRRIMPHIRTMYQIPLDELSLFQYAMIELEKAMLAIRKEANTVRLKPFMYRGHQHFDYLEGQLQGIRFGFASLLIFKTGDYSEFEERAVAYEAEMHFLTSSIYLKVVPQ